MKPILFCKSGPIWPETFDNDVGPLTETERLARYGNDGVAAQDAIIAKVKAHIEKVKKRRGG
jgi:hypothetical protein